MRPWFVAHWVCSVSCCPAVLLSGCAMHSHPIESTELHMAPKLYRVILPVGDIQAAQTFYARVLGVPGQRVSPGRHYFDCQGTILACFDPRADGDDFDASPNPDHIYFAVDDLDGALQRCRDAGSKGLDDGIVVQPWGERCFYATDPFGNKMCFVDRGTVFTGNE